MEKAPLPATIVGMKKHEELPEDVKFAMMRRFRCFESWKGNMQIFALEGEKYLVCSHSMSHGNSWFRWSVVNKEVRYKTESQDDYDEKMDYKYRDSYEEDYDDEPDDEEDY
jgi:hypothetical protein|tara:strand:+ start:640 stop:972 length:333 start_codon:yes stop_codon:yes gene_type:complete